MRIGVAITIACVCLGGVSVADPAFASIRKPTNIPAQELGPALRFLAKDRDVQVVYRSELVADHRTSGAAGDLTFEQALEQLLSGTGLTYRYLDDRAITILPLASGKADAAKDQRTSASPANSDDPYRSSKEAQKKSFWDRFRLAQVDQGQALNSRAMDPAAVAAPQAVEEIVVTAQKRMERLQDVPVPVTAVSASDLVDSNQVRLQDYYTRVPSLNVAPGIQATQVLTIRGISTGGGNPTVGVVIDDVPFGGTTALGSGNQIPDFDPSDLARIEVLRGPQGTLYGVNSMGGLIKFVTVDPSTEKLTGRVQAGLTTIRNGDDRGYNARGAINVPLGEAFAVRASGFARRDPGYIDDSGLGLQGVNEATAEGARLSALWRPTQDFSVKLSGLYQESAADASSDVFPSLGDLQQHYSVPGLGRYDIKNQAYSAVVNARLGRADLTALSGYNINRIFDSLDYTPFLGAGSPVLFGAGVTATPYAENQRVRKFSQEVRLSMPLGAKVDWLLGAFYTDESASRVQQIYAENPTTGVIAGQWLDNRFPTSYTEYAAFTDFTFHVTDRFNVQLGGRQSWNEATYESARVGPFVGPIPLIVPERKSDASAFTYIVTPQFRLSPEMMLYARLASGYRPGGPNTTAALAAGVPAEFDPDTTRNYEIGIKGNTPDRVVSYDASVFYIDWRDIQLDLRSSAGSYLDNGGRATSQGVELSLEVRPTSVLTIAAWTAWNDAKLKENLPLPPVGTVYGLTGDRLPLSSRFSGNLSLDCDLPLRGDMTAFFGVSLSYVGERLSIFRRLANGQPVPRQELPAYARTDVRAGIRYETWAGNLFVNNVTDRRGVLAGGAEQFNPLAFNYIQPRTIGVTLTKSF